MEIHCSFLFKHYIIIKKALAFKYSEGCESDEIEYFKQEQDDYSIDGIDGSDDGEMMVSIYGSIYMDSI